MDFLGKKTKKRPIRRETATLTERITSPLENGKETLVFRAVTGELAYVAPEGIGRDCAVGDTGILAWQGNRMIYFLKEGYSPPDARPKQTLEKPAQKLQLRRILKVVIPLAVLIGIAIGIYLFAWPEEAPKVQGVVEIQSTECYVVKIPEGVSLDTYFTMSKLHQGSVTVVETDVNSYADYHGTVIYDKTVSGNWIGTYGGYFMYIPATVTSEYTVRNAFIHLVKHNGSYMSFETAKQYIPALNK